MKYKVILVFMAMFFTGYAYAASEEQPLTAEQEQYVATVKSLLGSLDRQQGKVTLPNGVATLNVPDEFYYLSPGDTEKVLVELWGNPPQTAQGILGMLVPSGLSLLDDGSWAVTIEYEEDGYVSDENADEIDYNELLSQMKQGAREANKDRVEQGYEPIELVGWASSPYYDKASHKLHWAQELKFGDSQTNTLNYNLRVLGRKGVLVLNFIAGMDQKEMIESNLDAVLALAEFNQGSRYEDFNPDIDTVAAYGIGALVAGNVAVKTGLFAAALIFLKKFGVLIVIAIGAFLRKLFKRKTA